MLLGWWINNTLSATLKNLCRMSFFAKTLYTKKTEEIQKQPIRGVLRKSVLKIWSKLTGKHPFRSVISIKLLCNFIEIELRYECSIVNICCMLPEQLFIGTSMEGCFWRYNEKDTKNTINILILARKLPLKIILHIHKNCDTRVDKIILKCRKVCKSGPTTLRNMYYFKVIFPGFWQQVQNN